MEKVYRHGAAGALLDEYESALSDLKNIVNDQMKNWRSS